MRESPNSLLDLDSFHMSDLRKIIADANAIERGVIDCSSLMEKMILCPIFLQESSRTYINATTSFVRMGGLVLPLNMANTRLGSSWREPIRDFCTLINSCCDYVIVRLTNANSLLDFTKWCEVPMINGGNGSEHPVQALVDLFIIQQKFKSESVKILMVGGKHIRTTRTQVKLFHRFGYAIDIVSPPSPVDNSDMDSFYANNVVEYDDLKSTDLSKYDVLYHNGMDENSDIKSSKKYVVTLSELQERGFRGVVMHSLPRLNELESAIDDTNYNMYYPQMLKAKFVFQSIDRWLYASSKA